MDVDGAPPVAPAPRGAPEVLLIDDEPGQFILLRRAFEEVGWDGTLRWAETASEGLDRLARRGDFADAAPVDLVLLDLNMPDVDGHEVLRRTKADPLMRRVPIVVMSTSARDADILSCYQENANCYVVKPMDYEDLVVTVKKLKNFWLERVTLPSRMPGQG